MGNKPKKDEVATTPTFIVPERLLDRPVSDEQCHALAWRINAELADVHEVHIQKVNSQGTMIHALIVHVRIPTGMSNTSPLLGALVKKVDRVIYDMIAETIANDKFGKSKKTARATVR